MVINENRLLTVIAAAMLLGCFAAHGQEIRGCVTVDRSQPLSGAIIKIEVPGRSDQTKTDLSGCFKFTGMKESRVLVSVLQGDQLVYRAIREVTPGSTLEIGLAAVYDAPRGFDPVALAVLRGPEVYVADDRLHRFFGGNFEQTIVRSAKIGDIAAAVIGGEPAIFACVAPNQVVRYDRAGQVVSTWLPPGPTRNCASLAADSGSSSIFVGDSRSGEIFHMGVESPKPKFVWIASIPQGGELGPMAVDRVGRTLFVADALKGRIFAVRLANRKVDAFAHGLGEVRAMAVDEKRRRLYAADPGRDKIWQFDLSNDRPSAADFVGARNVRSAYAIGVDPADGSVYVGDRKSHALLVFSPDGELRSTAIAR